MLDDCEVSLALLPGSLEFFSDDLAFFLYHAHKVGYDRIRRWGLIFGTASSPPRHPEVVITQGKREFSVVINAKQG